MKYTILKIRLHFILKHCLIKKDRSQYYERGYHNEHEYQNYPISTIAYMREKLKHWAKANNLMDSKTVILGIANDDPKTTPPENCRYDACTLLVDKHFPAGGNVKSPEVSMLFLQ